LLQYGDEDAEATDASWFSSNVHSAARELLHVVPVEPQESDTPNEAAQPTFVCPHCGAPMHIIETLPRILPIRAPPRLRGPP